MRVIRWLFDWRNFASLSVAIIVAIAGVATIRQAQALKEREKTQRDSRAAATRRIDQLTASNTAKDSEINDLREAVGDNSARLEALAEQVRRLCAGHCQPIVATTPATTTPSAQKQPTSSSQSPAKQSPGTTTAPNSTPPTTAPPSSPPTTQPQPPKQQTCVGPICIGALQ